MQVPSQLKQIRQQHSAQRRHYPRLLCCNPDVHTLENMQKLTTRTFKKVWQGARHVAQLVNDTWTEQEEYAPLWQEYTSGTFTACDIKYTFHCTHNNSSNRHTPVNDLRVSSIVLQWCDPETGKPTLQTVGVTWQESNLPHTAPYMYFVFRLRSGRVLRSRTLYQVSNGMWGPRQAIIGARYEVQRLSSYGKIFRDGVSPDPFKKWGKMMYRNHITPYGKRVARWQSKYDIARIYLFGKGKLFGCNTASVHKERGGGIM